MAVEPIHAAPASPHLPPHNNDAEQSVLGAMLVNPNAIAVVIETLGARRLLPRVAPRRLPRHPHALRPRRGGRRRHPQRPARPRGRSRQGRRPGLRPHARRVRPRGGQRRLLRRDRAREQAVLRAAHPRRQRGRRARLQPPRRRRHPARLVRAEGLRHPAAAPLAGVPVDQGSPGQQLRAPRHAAARAGRHRRRLRLRGHRPDDRRLPAGQPHRPRRPPRRRQDLARPQHRPERRRRAARPRSPSSASR